jgi:hypothetical protein
LHARGDVLRFSEDRGLDYDPDANAIFYNDYDNGRVAMLGDIGGNAWFEGSVGIGGVKDPDEMLEVRGTTRTKEVIVESENWPDYVFSADYDLRSPAELAAFIEREGHLPALPSAERVKADGQTVGGVQRGLVQTVEELARYTIQQARAREKAKAARQAHTQRLDSLRRANQRLRDRTERQAQHIDELKQMLRTQQQQIDRLWKAVSDETAN